MKPEDRNWNPTEIETLKNNWQFKSATQIGDMMERTRNSICGMAHRLRGKGQLPDGPVKHYVVKPNFNRTPPKAKTLKVSVMKNGYSSPPPPPEEPPNPLPLIELEEHHCRWPLGDPREPDFGFCARARIAGMPYCPGHCAIAFNHQGKAA